MAIRNKRSAAGFALLMLLFFAVAGNFGFAWAEESQAILEIQVIASPAELVEPGDVTLSFTLENSSAIDAQNVYLSSADGLLSEPVGRVDAGESLSFSRQHSVSAAELSAGEISYTISHDDPLNPDGRINYTVRAAIGQSDAQPQVEFTRQFSSRQVEAGDTLTIIYRLRNTGNVALTGLRVQDELGDYTGRIDRLEAGESRALVSRVVITEAASSSAMLDFTVESSEQRFTQTLAEAPIAIAETELEMLFSVSTSAFSDDDAAQAVLTLTNTGNTAIQDVRITDEIYGGMIADALVIPADGAPVEVVRSYPLRGDMQFQWKISGQSASGKQISLLTQTQKLSACTAENPFAELSVEAMTLTPRIRKSGEVSVFIRIDHPGDGDIWNVALMEETLGEVYRFEVIPSGGISRELNFHISDDTCFNFYISYTDAQGNLRTQSAAPVEFTIASDGVLPEGAKDSFIEFTGKSIKIGGSSTFAVLLISGCAVLLVLIVLLLIASRRARFERRVRIAAAKQRRREAGTPSGKNKTKGR